MMQASFHTYVNVKVRSCSFQYPWKAFPVGNVSLRNTNMHVCTHTPVVAYELFIPDIPCFVLIRSHKGVRVINRNAGVVDVDVILNQLKCKSIIDFAEEADDELASGEDGRTSGFMSPRYLDSDQEASKSLLQQQRDAYQRSLESDRIKQRRKVAEMEKQEKIDKEKMEAESERQELLNSALQRIPQEPTIEEEHFKLAIQLPDGTKVLRRFFKDCDAQGLYAFVDSKYIGKDSFIADYRLQSLHPPFHIARQSLSLKEYPLDTQHKLYVDLTPIGNDSDDDCSKED